LRHAVRCMLVIFEYDLYANRCEKTKRRSLKLSPA
jgi:hypothetical protein